MRTKDEISQRLNEVIDWHWWLRQSEKFDVAIERDGEAGAQSLIDKGYALPAIKEPIPGYLAATTPMEVNGIRRALAWALGEEWDEASMDPDGQPQ